MMPVDLAPDAEAAAQQGWVVTVASDRDSDPWDRYVGSHPASTGYHTWGWRGVFVRAFAHEPVYLIARCGGRVAGVLPLVQMNSLLFGRTLTSLPFLNYGGVVADSAAVERELLDAAAAVARSQRCRHIELRHTRRHFEHLPYRQHKVAMHLRLHAGMWDRLDRKVRNQIRKAQKSGLLTERGGANLLPEFYAVFARNMRDLGTPVYSPRFFQEIFGAFPARARIHVVRLEGRPVAAGLAFETRSTVEVPWASSVRDYNHLCPNHLLYWSVVEASIEKGCDVLDFGRSTPGGGTFKFKEQWGAEPVPLHWEYQLMGGSTVLPDASPSNPKFRLAIACWQRLPLALATRLGPVMARTLG